MDEEPENERARNALSAWKKKIEENNYQRDRDFQHSVGYYLAEKCPGIEEELSAFGERVVRELEPLVIENNLAQNLPRLERYDGLGRRIEKIVHHPSYEAAGNIIYGSRLLERLAKPGGLSEALAFMFLSSQAGEAGHNCPVACSAGMIRALQRAPDFPRKSFYIKQLCLPSYSENFTGAQFLTEIQGGSDVGQNATRAFKVEGQWKIRGEKWFCSNADAELIFVTARFDEGIPGTKGLGLFLVPSQLESGAPNHYAMRRLKDKIGTRSMASAEIDFQDALAIPVGEPEEGFKMVMENVLHISRLFNTFCVLGMARRAYHIAYAYAQNRVAFGKPIIQFPLVRENLARIKAENTALLASIFATAKLQDDLDTGLVAGEEKKLLLRLLANLNKYLSALWSVDHLHHALDVLAGNGAIESFSTIPRLLRDSIVCENWEGTHNVLRLQILKDIQKYELDRLYLDEIESGKLRLDAVRQAVARLKTDLKILKDAEPELQSFLIKSVVDQMAYLYAAVHLWREAQEQAQTSTSKMHCLNYFILLHLNEERVGYDQNHLNLVDAVLEGL